MTIDQHDAISVTDNHPNGTTATTATTDIDRRRGAYIPDRTEPTHLTAAERDAEELSRTQRYRAAMVRSRLNQPGTTTEQVIEAAADYNPAVRRTALAHCACPRQVRLAALLDPDPEVRAQVVRVMPDPADLPPGVATDQHWQVRAALAERADSPTQIVLELLHRDPDPEVRRRALAAGAVRRDVVRRILREAPEPLALRAAPLATDSLDGAPGFVKAVPHAQVREAIARRPRLDPDMLRWLAFEDSDPVVRAGAVSNPRLPRSLLARAFRDPQPEPREAAVLRVGFFPPELLDSAADDASPRVRLASLAHDPLDPAIPARLSQNPDASVRAAACHHANCPAEALAVAAEDHDASVRRAAVQHPALPRSALAGRCADEDPAIRYLAVRHPAVPPASSAFDLFRESEAELTVKVKADDRSATNRRARARRMNESAAAALTKALWDELQPLPLTALPRVLLKRIVTRHLDNAVTDCRVTIRRLVVDDPGVTGRHLVTLSADPDPRVRAAVGERLLAVL